MLWAGSWLELYLEIYRHHHVAPRFLGVSPAPEIGSGAHAGVWLVTVLITSGLAPVAWGVGWLWSRRRGPDHARFPNSSSRTGLAWGLVTSGALLSIFGGLNQVVQGTPLDVDLTLRHGSGGFVVDGLILLLMGGVLRWRIAGQCDRAAG